MGRRRLDRNRDRRAIPVIAPTQPVSLTRVVQHFETLNARKYADGREIKRGQNG